MKKIFCIISHTHWDREWYLTFEQFRLKLVDLIDRLLLIIEKYPNYIFHLDAQTIVLEDYLEIRSNNRDILEKYIKSGNIVVGPWYLQNDFYLTSGEATIRNLLEGRKIAESFGKCANTGYAPDQFGHISQLPQILNDFGIDNYIFGRGFNKFYRDKDGIVKRQYMPIEFRWKGADDSELLAFNLRNWYNNAQRLPVDPQKAKIITDITENEFNNKMSTEYYLMMNGVDHLEAQDDLIEAIDNFNAEFGEEYYMKQYNLDEYINDFKISIVKNNKELTSHKGELRMGSVAEMLSGTLSSRVYIKIWNDKMQNMYEQMLEPLYSTLELNGLNGIYSYDHFKYGWKKLMKNHPHDTICGCSTDAVHRHSEDEFQRLFEFSNELFERGKNELFYHSELVKNADEQYYAINVTNTTSKEMSGAVYASISFISSDKTTGFAIKDINGNEVAYELLGYSNPIIDIVSPLNLPGNFKVDKFDICFDAGTVNPYSTKGFLVIPKTNTVITLAEKINKPILENEYLKVEVDERGRVNITDKINSNEYKDAIYIEDRTDRGHSYEYFGSDDAPILSKQFKPLVEVIENNSLEGKIKIKWDMAIPKFYNFDEIKRSDENEIEEVSLILRLEKGKKTLNIDFTVNNKCSDHRLRLVVNSGLSKSAECMSDMPFDIIKRVDCFYEVDPKLQVFPNTSFVSLSERGKGLAVFTNGLHASERITDGEIAFTLVRATGRITRFENLEPVGGKMWEAPENQCIREISGTIGITAFSGNLAKDDIPNLSIMFRNPLSSFASSVNRKLFSGGRAGVQGSISDGIYYLPDIWSDAVIKDNKSAVTVEGEGICVSALKLAEDKNGLVLRFNNYKNEDTVAEIQVEGKIYLSDMSEKSREFLGNNFVKIKVKPKKITTLYIEYK